MLLVDNIIEEDKSKTTGHENKACIYVFCDAAFYLLEVIPSKQIAVCFL